MFLNLLFGGFTCFKVSKPPKQGLQPYGVLRCFEQKRRSRESTHVEAWKALPEKLTSEDKDKDFPERPDGKWVVGVWSWNLGGAGFLYEIYI